MSSLRPIDYRLIEELVEIARGCGYVLDLSDVSFSQFFEVELDVDIDDPVYAENGGSKGKRLRTFLTKVNDPLAARTLKALWEYRRDYLDRTRQQDPVQNAEGRYLTLIQRLAGAGETGEPAKPAHDRAKIEAFRSELYALREVPAQERGYAFERYLMRLFGDFGLAPRHPFRNVGEQIDGSFLLDQEVYLLEAKWTSAPTGAGELRAFHGKLDKAAWTRGLFISYSGFSSDGLAAFGMARRMFCVEGRDIYEALERQIPLVDLLRAKIRHAAETGEPFVPIVRLFGKG